ncbi:DUF3300 domain-containing protein [Luteibacter sp. dw_328]|uniref:DUF3300 domain-containing protein n=1 Tax=Luteibacter sp. dw_328 TaxID=2719796 RepID=UPI0031F31FDF
MNARMVWRVGIAALCALGVPVASAQAPAPAPAAQNAPAPASAPVFKKEQIDQFMAPIALYPDALLSQVLMASTYPADVADAAAWSKANPKATGDAAVKQVANQPWDPSVQSMVAFPPVLAQMGAHPDWVRNVGDAFLAQPDDVMGSVQRLRAQAQKAGNLKSTEQQKVIVQQTAPTTTIIQIEPADPQVVYVPSYNPTVVYGTWAYPAYPPPYYPPPPGYYHPVATGLAAGLAFGTGIAVANSLWGGCDWGHNDVNINVNRYNNMNVNNRISGNGNTNWNHNPANRRGTPYNGAATQQRFNQGVGGAQQRQAFRGQAGGADASRQRAMQSFDRTTNGGAAASARRPGETFNGSRHPGGAGNAGNRADLGNRANGADRQGGLNNRPGANGGGIQHQPGASQARANAFSGVRSPGDGAAQREQGQRSMQSLGGQRGGASAGRQINRPVPARAGGGGFHRR